MIYVPTNNFKEVAEMIIDHPWGDVYPYSQKAVILAMESLRNDDFAIMERIAGSYDYDLPGFIDEIEDLLADNEWQSPMDREGDYLTDLKYGYWAEIWDIGRGHYDVVIHHNDINDGAPLASVTYYAFAHPATEENYTFEDGDGEMFQELAEQAVSKYNRFCQE
jgi:hypothetical protein